MLDVIEALVKRRGWRYGRLDGSTAIAGRQWLVDAFNDSRSDMFIMLMTPRTGGVGLNLTGADRVVLFDPDWNPQVGSHSSSASSSSVVVTVACVTTRRARSPPSPPPRRCVASRACDDERRA